MGPSLMQILLLLPPLAGTKINPDFGSQDVATTGNMQAGTPTVDHITVNGGDLTVSGDAEIGRRSLGGRYPEYSLGRTPEEKYYDPDVYLPG